MYTCTRITVLLMSILISGRSLAQQAGFITIVSETARAYSVTVKGETYRSTPSGYLSLPQLAPGEYIFELGFPDNVYLSWSFSCSIRDKSKGYTLKRTVDNSWALFDMVDFTLLTGTRTVNNAPAVAGERWIIKKVLDQPGKGGIDQVYILTGPGKTDTVTLFIPDLEEIKPAASLSRSTGQKPAQQFTGRKVGQSASLSIPQLISRPAGQLHNPRYAALLS